MSDQEQFRQQTRAWLEENCPQPMRGQAHGIEGRYANRGTVYLLDARAWFPLVQISTR